MADPLYRQIADDLAGKIESGELARGSRLPTEIELRESYGYASRNNVRDAIKLLTARGFVYQVPGRGPCVADPDVGPVDDSADARPAAGIYFRLDDISHSLYRRIADDLRKRIESGDLMAGTPLYGEVLREHYKVSRNTVRDALSWLAVHRFILAQPGQASTVLEVGMSKDVASAEDSFHGIELIDLDDVSSRLDFGCALAALMRHADLTQWQVEHQTNGLGDGDLTDYLSGRRLPQAPELLRKILMTCAVDEEEQIEQWMRTLARVRALLPEKKTGGTTSRDDDRMNLLFRVYVPSGRLYAAEAQRLISLFQDWLTRVRGLGIRYDGYSTAAGKVYEFLADSSLIQSNLSEEFGSFSEFLTLCSHDSGAAVAKLIEEGIGSRLSSDLVARFGKEARRLEVDVRHDRERRILSIRHDLEEELLDKATYLYDLPGNQVSSLLDTLIPIPSTLAPMALLVGPEPGVNSPPITLNINPQFISAIESTIVHNVEGSLHFGPQAKDILALIDRFGGQESMVLKSALHEIEDTDARPGDRMAAMGRLKNFLHRLTGAAQDVAVGVLEKYIEAKIGL